MLMQRKIYIPKFRKKRWLQKIKSGMVEERMSKHQGHAFTVLITGLSGAGKSTLAEGLKSKLNKEGLGPVQIIDSETSANICQDLHNSYTREAREATMKRYVYLSNILNQNGVIALIARIAHTKAARQFARKSIDRFLEIYVKCSLDECVRRDDKGVYERAIKGCSGEKVVGVNEEYEEHDLADLVLETERISPEICVDLAYKKITDLVLKPGV